MLVYTFLKNEMRPVNFESLDNLPSNQRKSTPSRPYEDSSDDSNWDMVLSKGNGEILQSYFGLGRKCRNVLIHTQFEAK